MANWVRLCASGEAPAEGELRELDVENTTVCLARIDGVLHALDNLCPHRDGPLGQGWIEGQSVICPWHAWAFDVCSGQCVEPETASVRVYPLQDDGHGLFVDLA